MKWILTILLVLSQSLAQSTYYYARPAAAGGTAIAYYTSSSGSEDISTTCSFNIVISDAMTAGYIFVGASSWDETTGTSISSATFNGSAMTSLEPNYTISGGVDARIFGLAVGNLASGTYAVVVTMSSSTEEIACTAVAFNNVHQTTSVGTVNKQTSNTTTPSVNVTSVAGDIVVDIVAANEGVLSTTSTAGAGQTKRQWTAFGDNYQAGATSTETATTTTTTMSWTLDSGGTWGIIGVAIKPANP